MDFEVLINDLFTNISNDDIGEPNYNKHLLSLVNDFEDGKWREKKFHNFIWDNIKETALSLQERNSLAGKENTILDRAAKNLRLSEKEGDIGQGSELAEIALYGIMKHHYKALPVVPKIFYKQNTQDNAKGADSVHIIIDESGDFTLWFGEAKFYSSIEDARLASIVASVKNSLHPDKLRKENAIITNISEITHLDISEELKNKIRDSLDQKKSLDEIKPRINIPILIIHECKSTQNAKELSDIYKQEIIKIHTERASSYFKKQIKEVSEIFKYSEIKFHLILFPVPHKSPIIDKFVAKVEFHKGE